MQKNWGFLFLFAAAVAMGEGASAETPSLMWRDARQVAVQCLVQPTNDANRALGKDLCERVRALASENAPVPAANIAQGDPAILAPGTVTLLVHASVQPAERGRLLVFNIRPFRVSAEQNSILFSAAPRAAIIPPSGSTSPALEAALAAAMSELLPWQARAQSPRMIAKPSSF